MQYKNGMPIAIIGAGISGITTAQILKKNGFQAVVLRNPKRLAEYGQLHTQTYTCKISENSIIYQIFRGPSRLIYIPRENKSSIIGSKRSTI